MKKTLSIIFLLILWFSGYGQGIKISALPEIESASIDTAEDVFPIVHSGVTYKVTVGSLFGLFGSAGGSGTPAGSNTQIQFNDDGAFGADADFTWDNSGGKTFVAQAQDAVLGKVDGVHFSLSGMGNSYTFDYSRCHC